jgi:predicted small metal-binding protein
MNRRLSAAALALVLAFGTVAFVRAEGAAKSEKDQPLKMAACPPECGFACTSRDEKELVEVLKTHAKTHHDMDLTDEQARGMIKPVAKPAAAKETAKGEAG